MQALMISNNKAVSSWMFLLSSLLVLFGGFFLEDTNYQKLFASPPPPKTAEQEKQALLLQHDEADDCVTRFPEAILPWDAVAPARRQILEYRGWTAERWDRDGNKCNMPPRQSTPDAFYVHVVQNLLSALPSASASALSSMNSSMLSEMDETTSIPLVSGGTDDYNEDWVTSKSLSEIFQGIRQGDTSFYLHLEEVMPEKASFKFIGDRIINSLLPFVRDHKELHRAGLWNPRWDAIDPHLENDDSFDWAMFAGAKGTKTPLHYDDDLFNFLYLIEGRKRIVIIPNDERTHGKFTTHQNEDGGTGWGELDVFHENATLPEHAVEIVLEAGQAIALPYLCWHAVLNLENTLAVSFRLVDW